LDEKCLQQTAIITLNVVAIVSKRSPKITRTKDAKPNFRAQTPTAAKSSPIGIFSSTVATLFGCFQNGLTGKER